MLPHAIAELAELGLLARLDEVAVRTRELIYANRFGQEIWREPRGLEAGYQGAAVLDPPRPPAGRPARCRMASGSGAHGGAHAATPSRAFAQEEGAVKARFKSCQRVRALTVAGDILVGCDGIHSAVRRQLYPDEAGLKWNGVLMWRGATLAKGFLDGRTMIVGGGFNNKLVLYPIAPRQERQSS